MGQFFGRRPDPTPSIRRALRRRFLESGEEVLAGVYLQTPGTISAGIAGGTSAGIGSATGVHGATFSRGRDPKVVKWEEEAVRLHAVDPGVAKRTIWVALALTRSRLLLVRRSAVLRRPREMFASWPLPEVDSIKVPRNGSSLRIVRGGAELKFELPNGLKFLSEVYAELPAMFERAKADARPNTL